MRYVFDVLVFVFCVFTTIYLARESDRRTELSETVKCARYTLDREAELLQEVAAAQKYAEPLTISIQALTAENTYLIEREKSATQIVKKYSEEAARLKEALNESVEMLKQMTDENNSLMEENTALQQKVALLEDTVKSLRQALDKLAPQPDEVIVPDVPIPFDPKSVN